MASWHSPPHRLFARCVKPIKILPVLTYPRAARAAALQPQLHLLNHIARQVEIGGPFVGVQAPRAVATLAYASVVKRCRLVGPTIVYPVADLRGGWQDCCDILELGRHLEWQVTLRP